MEGPFAPEDKSVGGCPCGAEASGGGVFGKYGFSLLPAKDGAWSQKGKDDQELGLFDAFKEDPFGAILQSCYSLVWVVTAILVFIVIIMYMSSAFFKTDAPDSLLKPTMIFGFVTVILSALTYLFVNVRQSK